MVFRYEGGQVTVSGQPLVPMGLREENYKRVGKHLLLTPEQARAKMAPEHRQKAMLDVQPGVDPFDASLLPDGAVTLANLPDPFGSLNATAALDVFTRQRHILDNGAYVSYWLDAMVPILDERIWLDQQLAVPEFMDHPARPDAVKRQTFLQSELGEYAELISWSEAHADRCWQTLTEAEREPVAHMWLTQPTDARLVGRSWQDQARFFRTWPTGAYVDGRWFVNLHNVLYLDIAHLWNHGPTWLGEPVEMPPDDQSHLDGWHARLMSG